MIALTILGLLATGILLGATAVTWLGRRIPPRSASHALLDAWPLPDVPAGDEPFPRMSRDDEPLVPWQGPGTLEEPLEDRPGAAS